MSVQTIKGSRQKTAADNYSDFIPFGTDGEYVDMLSGLTLERELKLGGDHSASIGQDSSGNTVITERYADEETIGAYYKVVTTITEGSANTTITSRLYWVNSQGNDILKNIKTIVIEEDGSETEITEVLS